MEKLTSISMLRHSETILGVRAPELWGSNSIEVWAAVFMAFSLMIYTLYTQKETYIDLPHVGIPKGPLCSWRAGFSFLLNSHNIICDGYKKYSPSGKAYVVSSLPRKVVFLTDHDQMEELRRAADQELSFKESMNERFGIERNFGLPHVPADFVQKNLTQHLFAMLPEVENQLELAFINFAKFEEEWTRIKVGDFFPELVARTVNTAFVGAPLCQNKEYLRIAVEFSARVSMTGVIADHFPSLIRKGVVWWLFKRHKLHDRAIRLCGPLFDERRSKQRELGDKQWAAVKPRDPIQWLLDGVASQISMEPLTNESLTLKLLMLNFAATHTTLFSIVHLLYDVTSHPEYIDPLRDEINCQIKAHGGLTPQAISMMYKLDSCLKESQRLNGVSSLIISRMALKDYTFKTGHSPFTLPKGMVIGLPSNAVHVSQEIYGTDSEQWNGFRFSDLREGLDASQSSKHQAVTTSYEYLPFGHGKHACPGRFFAVMQIKLVLCHLLLNYDIRFPEKQGGKRPQNKYFSGIGIADLSAELEFKLRKL